jgi:hypothetical protein
MRRVPDISSRENFRIVPIPGWPGASNIRRDPIEPVPVGTYVAMAFRVIGYDPDCDGSLMARLAHVDEHGKDTGWDPHHLGLYPSTDVVLDSPAELFETADRAAGIVHMPAVESIGAGAAVVAVGAARAQRWMAALHAIADAVPARGDRGGDCAYCDSVGAMDIIERHEEDCPWRIAKEALEP